MGNISFLLCHFHTLCNQKMKTITVVDNLNILRAKCNLKKRVQIIKIFGQIGGTFKILEENINFF